MSNNIGISESLRCGKPIVFKEKDGRLVAEKMRKKGSLSKDEEKKELVIV